MDDFVRDIRWCYQDGTINRQDAVFAIKSHFLGMSNEDAEDELDGYIVVSAKRFQLLTSMARVEDNSYIPAEIGNLFPGCDGWIGDFKHPDKKLVCQLDTDQGIFYFCFGRSRSAQHSLGESKADNRWLFKSVVLHANGSWYYNSDFDSEDLLPVRNYVYKIASDVSTEDVISHFNLQSCGSGSYTNALDFCC